MTDAETWMEKNKVDNTEWKTGGIVYILIHVQDTFSLIGDVVSMEYCRQRKGTDLREGRRDFDADWTCFKVFYTFLELTIHSNNCYSVAI